MMHKLGGKWTFGCTVATSFGIKYSAANTVINESKEGDIYSVLDTLLTQVPGWLTSVKQKENLMN